MTGRRCMCLIVPLLVACNVLTPLRAILQRSVPTAQPTSSPNGLTPPPIFPSRTPSPTVPLPTPVMSAEGRALQSGAMLPDFAADVQSMPNATRYEMALDISFDPHQPEARLEGTARMVFTNTSTSELRDVVLMLWPNDPQYRAVMFAGQAMVGDTPVTGTQELNGLALRLPLWTPLVPGESLQLEVPFSVESSGLMASDGFQRFGITEGVFVAPTFYPLLPRLADGGWQAEAAPPGGDTTNSDIAFYDLRITIPSDIAIVTTGTEIEEGGTNDDTRTVRIVSGPARDFALALGSFELHEQTVGGVMLRAWVLPEHAEQAEGMLQAAGDQVRLLGNLLGTYPYAELDLVDAPGNYGGIEYPGLIFIGSMGSSWLVEPTVHEVAHQWFYGLVGNDQLNEPWLDEAAASYGEVLYFEQVQRRARDTGLLTDFRNQVRFLDQPDLPIGLAVEDYPSPYDYGVLVYMKGALFFDALRQELGDDIFFRFLKTYFQQQRYSFSSAATFQATAEQVCGCDLDGLFRLWVYEGGKIPGL